MIPEIFIAVGFWAPIAAVGIGALFLLMCFANWLMK